jgi:Protein of unknown function (DUF2934)
MREQSGEASMSGAKVTNVRAEPSSTAELASLRTSITDERLAAGFKLSRTHNPLNAKHRHQQIAEAAYYRAEARGFAPGFEVNDWLAAARTLGLS